MAVCFSTIVDINLSRDQLLLAYQGVAKSVNVRARSGERIKFPIDILRPFVTELGVHGVFEIQYDQAHKFVQIICVQKSL